MRKRGVFQALAIATWAGACSGPATRGDALSPDASTGPPPTQTATSGSSGASDGASSGGSGGAPANHASGATAPQGGTAASGADGGSGAIAPAADGGAAGAAAVDSDIANLVAGISADRISQSIQTLVAFGTRSSCSTQTTGSQGIVAARDWIKSQFDAVPGLTTSLFTYAQTGCSQTLMRDDVVAILPGKQSPKRIVLVGGHYDSRTISVTDGTSPAPGANDSGSQTALVLELARAFTAHSFDASLVFVAFAGEEQGLIGSKALAANVGTLANGGEVVAMLNCDIVGGNTDTNGPTELQEFRLYSPGTPREVSATTPDGTPDDTSPSRGLMRYVATWGAAYVPAMTIVPELREDRPGRGGDHESFIAAGRPGVRFIETVESPNAGTTASHEHSPNDLFTYVTPPYTARVAEVVASVAASLARAPDAPGSFAVSGNGAGPALTWTAPGTGAVHHYVVAARPVTENFYHARVPVDGSKTAATVTPAALGVDPSAPYFVSVAAVDAAGHESLFAYPEYRCDASQCVVPAAATNITATK
ncbi:MAG TPA: M28 family metallopeptidase [Polyangiaceae bacterium]|nr:M28 family metallopeptidase [Polyangiaceae bacterium]